MTINQLNFPESYLALRVEIRDKAISIANILHKNGFDKEISYCIGYTNARLLANYDFNSLMAKQEHLDVRLVPHLNGWVLISEDAEQIYFLESEKNDGLNRSREMAKSLKVKLYIHSSAGLICDSESFKVNKPSNSPTEEKQFQSLFSAMKSGRQNSYSGRKHKVFL